MPEFTSEAVPFQTSGNRRFLSDRQLREDGYLAAFVRRFPASFERDDVRFLWWFVEPALSIEEAR